MVGGTRASSVGDGVGAIEIGLALGLIDATEERNSEDEESEISAMTGTSDDKQRLAQTRAELREADQEALCMAASHETPSGNIFDPCEGDDDGDEIETLREANAEIQICPTFQEGIL